MSFKLYGSSLETRARRNNRAIDMQWIHENELNEHIYGSNNNDSNLKSLSEEALEINRLLDSIELDEELFDEKEDYKPVEEVSEVEQILDSTDVPEIEFEEDNKIQEEIDRLNEAKARITSMEGHLNSVFATDDYDHDFTTGRSR